MSASVRQESFRVRFIEERLQEGHSTLDFLVSSRYDDYELKVRLAIISARF